MKNTICLIIPYFGHLPSYANLFFRSLAYNQNIDVLLFTDSDCHVELPNLKIVRSTLSAVKRRAQRLLDFKISLDNPYKLCDYKPLYGLLFQKYLKGYTFWGHCDLDLVLGDTKQFLTDDILNQYDKIYQHGHFCLYRNVPEVNNAFELSYGMNYRKVLSTSVICVFDEIPGIQQKFDHEGFQTYKGWDFFDVNPWQYHMTRVTSFAPEIIQKEHFDYVHECFFWENGHVFREALAEGGKLRRDEFIYLHFQKRNFYTPDNIIRMNSFYLTNDGCVPKAGTVSVQNLDRYNQFSQKREKEFRQQEKKFIWKRRINKYLFHRG